MTEEEEEKKKIDVEVSIGSEDINNYLVKAILDSKLGALIEKEVMETIEQIERSWSNDNPIKMTVKNEVERITREVVREKYNEKINECIVENISDENIKELVAKFLENVIRKIDYEY